MKQKIEVEQTMPRPMAEIFKELQLLAQSDGALHEISAIIYRDWAVTVDTQEGRVIDDREHRWSSSKLNTNELMLLLGLSIQSQSDRTYSIESVGDTFAERADELLREFHECVLKDTWPTFNEGKLTHVEHPEAVGRIAREAIYYGADSFYLHQFPGFSRQRYRNDLIWLLQNVGLSIRPMLDIAKYISNRINEQMTYVGYMRNKGSKLSHGDLTASLLISKSDLSKRFGQKAQTFLEKFATASTGANSLFTDPFAVNLISITPLIDLGDHIYVPSQYRLFEAIYESPFYWMMADKSYRDTAAEHRGAFLEKTGAHILQSVFGANNVYENVTIQNRTKDIAGEVDVLVVYGEFVLVVQAKSKRVTVKARSGDADALKTDFEGAIQKPYIQALNCAELISKGVICTTKDGVALPIPPIPRLFPVVLLSDPFPASTYLSSTMLLRRDNIAPVIWDIGVLDCVSRLLPTPIEMIFYLKCRAEVFDKIHSDSEYNFLGYHIRAKLAMPPDVDWMHLDRDFATVVDDYMIPADIDIKAKRPLGILERLEIPVISSLFAELKKAEPSLASVVVDLYDFSSAALEHLSATIIKLRAEIFATGKAIKAISIPTNTGGLTYAVTKKFDANARRAAEAIGAKHKYDSKRDRWYVLVDSIETKNSIDGLLPLLWHWEENELEAKASEEVAKIFGSRQEDVTIGEAKET